MNITIGKIGGEDWVGTNDGGVGRLLFKLQDSERIRDDLNRLAEENAKLREMIESYKIASDNATKYRYALSYNESYAGEPVGEMKNNLADLDVISCKAIKLLNQLKDQNNDNS